VTFRIIESCFRLISVSVDHPQRHDSSTAVGTPNEYAVVVCVGLHGNRRRQKWTTIDILQTEFRHTPINRGCSFDCRWSRVLISSWVTSSRVFGAWGPWRADGKFFLWSPRNWKRRIEPACRRLIPIFSFSCGNVFQNSGSRGSGGAPCVRGFFSVSQPVALFKMSDSDDGFLDSDDEGDNKFCPPPALQV